MTEERSGAASELELVFERLDHGIVRVVEDLTVVSANAAARRQFHPARLRAGRALPEPWPGFSLVEVVRGLFGRPARARPTVRVPAHVADVHTSDGRVFHTTAFPPDGDGTALLHIENRTSTDRRSRAERDFIADAAHELLTPLTGIVTAAFALEAGAKAVPEDRDRFISHIATHADRLTRVARALLIVARAQSGQQPPRLEAVPLRPLLDDALAATDPDHASQVTLSCAADVEVFVDRDLAAQAFTNLVANAARHARGAPITVSVGEVGDHEVAVDFANPGGTIAPEELAHVAERFYAGGGRDAGGFGLGVSIAAQAIELLGGTLSYASEPGEGTRARVQLRSGRVAHS